MGSILDGLNAAQTAAVTSAADVVQILAPPGSGKTKTLTSRVAYLLSDYNYKPWNVICLTFSNKSANEMKDRISKLIGNGMEKQIVLGTFHSVCRRYLISYGHLINVPKGFGIADGSDTLNIIKRITKRRRLNIDPQKARSRISQSKAKGVKIEDILNMHRQKRNVDQEEFITVFEDYEKQLATSNLLDFDDLLARCVDLLQRYPQCVSNVEAVLIDEFQDTSVLQFELMTLFASRNNRITTVGDMDQSIYGWRSAEIENLKRMQKQYPDTLVINLEENYRSSASILLIANEVIEQDTSRSQKPMVPTHCLGTTPVLRRLPSAELEAYWIVSEIRRTRALTAALLTFSDFAILLRSAALSRIIESAFVKSGIPYRMVGGLKFYDRAEIKILLDYLRAVSQPENNDAIARVINVPPRGVGDTTIKALLEYAEESKVTLWKVLGGIIQGSRGPNLKVSKNASVGIGSFAGIVKSCRSRMMSAMAPAYPQDLLQLIIKKIDFKTYLEKSHPGDYEARCSNVDELSNQAAEYQVTNSMLDGSESADLDDTLPMIDDVEQERSSGPKEALSRFLANVALTTELQRENEADADGQVPQHQVTISTIHAAKGLEWPVVFVTSTCDGIIPHSRAEDSDEERRLLYVAMTRAQTLLYLSCPVKNSQREEATLSPFLSEKNVQAVLVNRGPTIDPAAACDIAKILRREPPKEDDIIDATKDFESLEDDKWSLDGSESIEAIQARLARWSEEGIGRPKTQLAKRGRLETSEDVGSMYSASTVNVGFKTTMQAASTFLCNANVGFTTASVQMQAISSMPKPEPLQIERASKKVKIAPTKSDQSNLLSLWRPKSNIEKPHQDIIDAKPALPKQVMPKIEYHVIDDDAAMLPQQMSRGAIPSALAARRLPSNTMAGRPFSKSIEEASHSNGYLFLSSSSPPPEEPPQTEVVVEQTRPQNSEQLDSPFCAKRPAADIIGNVHRKTLGVRRSMAGWNGTRRPGFTVPRMASTQR